MESHSGRSTYVSVDDDVYALVHCKKGTLWMHNVVDRGRKCVLE